MKLMISEKIYRYRKEKDMTQEELAAALDVTPQAVSNWERGGYPDITLLPGLANLFGVTIDDLMGNDESGKEKDYRRYDKMRRELGTAKEKLELAMEYRRKYPADLYYMYHIANNITDLILEEPSENSRYMPLMNEVCEKMMENYRYRTFAIHFMTILCEDSELDHWLRLTASGQKKRENLISRYMRRDDSENQQRQEQLQMIERLSVLFDSTCPDQAGPLKKAAHHRSLIALMDGLKIEGKLPDGWVLHYAYKKLVLSACLFGAGENDEGWQVFEEAMGLFRQWFVDSPADAVLELDGGGLFGGLKVSKNWDFCLAPTADQSGCHTYKLYEHTRLFNYTPDRLRDFLNNPRWAWYNSARSDPRYIAAVEWADSLSKTE
ncbi:MAG: helix-turn-helix transcriptional regulator [Clostridia bacterium]|nr:helix-turn-helix transcriptional regulator [Clostridia bacterium]